MKNLIILTLSILAICQFSSCEKDNNCVTGSGGYTSKTYSKPNFNSIYIYGDADVYITKDSISSIQIEGQQNILSALNVSVTNENLSIGNDNCFENASKLTIYLHTSNLKGVYVAGVCNVYSPDNFSGSSFETSISGTGSISVNVIVQEFRSIVSGEGTISASGIAKNHDISISGSGIVNSFNLIGESADINVSGTANIEVQVSNSLDVTISGKGDIYYKGYPTIVSNISGSGNIIDSN